MRVFVTGHKGFIGSHLVKRLNSLSIDVTGYDLKDGNDIRDVERLKSRMVNCDFVVHLAAFVSVPKSWEAPEETFDHNFTGTLNVIRTAISKGIKRIVFASSAACDDPFSSPYALSKYMCEGLFTMYEKELDSVCLRFFNVYGEGQNPEYAGVIDKFIKDIRDKGEVTIFGDGEQNRDFVYVKDVVEAVFKSLTLTKGFKGSHASDVGTGNSISINDLASLMSQIMNKEIKINYEPAREEVRYSYAYPDPKIVGQTNVNLKEGLTHLIGDIK